MCKMEKVFPGFLLSNNKLKILKVAQVKDEMDGDEDDVVYNEV